MPSLIAIYMSLNLQDYVESVRDTLKPPVSNKILFDGAQIKVMVVGGPNQRKDFHIEKGEELFYMLIGDMDLDIVENGQLRRIHIEEGKFFLLPSCVPHSPQRYSDTIGIVFERERFPDELDCLRWYVPDDTIDKVGSTEVLYEEMFHCTDLGTQIKAVIERFNASLLSGTIDKMKITDVAIAAYFNRPDSVPSEEFSNFVLKEEVQAMSSKILEAGAMTGVKTLIQGEFRVDLMSNSLPVALNCEIGGDVFLWQQSGVSEIYESELESVSYVPPRKATSLLRAGEVMHLKRRLLSNSSPILVSQLEVGGVVVTVTNSSILPI